MSSSSRSDADSYCDVEELLQIESRCRELRKEKDLLRESQSESFDLIRRLEQHVKSLSENHAGDKKKIQNLARELMNCSQEIDYLQDQLNMRNTEVYSLGEHAHNLELKLADMKTLQVEVCQLREELKWSDSECKLVKQELESKEVVLQKATLQIGRLEELISSLTLESQCEIESLKLEIMSMEHACHEAEKVQEEAIQEKERTNSLINELELKIYEARESIECLGKENMELKEKLVTYDKDSALLLQRKIEEFLDSKQINSQSYSRSLNESNSIIKEESCNEVLGSLFSKLAIVSAPTADLKEQVESMSNEISKYELLAKQLKEELREEKLKAKEEAEDLAQEMAELRYQMTCLLEEERKRRACIEQASLQRIAELEEQVQNERMKFAGEVKHLCSS